LPDARKIAAAIYDVHAAQASRCITDRLITQTFDDASDTGGVPK
jgi:hypothetical protein